MSDLDRAMFDRGFEDGNYCSAYITQDYAEAISVLHDADLMFRAGHALGFFSSYELHEIEGNLNGQPLCYLIEHWRIRFKDWL